MSSIIRNLKNIDNEFPLRKEGRGIDSSSATNRSPWKEEIDAKKLKLPLAVFTFTFFLLAMVQVKLTGRPMILIERFIENAGWIEIVVISCYGAFLAYKMQDPLNVPKWRRISWTLFSVVFFSQLIIGLLGIEKFLMTGKLHLPIPAMILAGPVFRGELSFMTILFLSTIVLTGPAWCSQLCYFGAFDNMASSGKTKKGEFKHKKAIKATILFWIVSITLVLRWLQVPTLYATLSAIAFALIGISIMIFVSRKKGKMVHCSLYCPVGTMVNVMKPVNPFKMYIDSNCTLCMKCTTACKYDALNVQDIKNKKPGFTCTYCGDCLSECHHNSIKYKFFKLKPQTARFLYLFLTISVHAVFLALARI